MDDSTTFQETIDETIGKYSEMCTVFVNDATEEQSNHALALAAVWLRTDEELRRMSSPEMADEEWQRCAARAHYGMAMIATMLSDMNIGIRTSTDAWQETPIDDYWEENVYGDQIGDSDGHP